LEPFPKVISQTERQLVRYSDNHHIFSPYPITNQKTTLKLASNVIESKSEQAPTIVKGDTITYGPYDNVKSFSLSPLKVHFENSKPFITVSRFQRDIEVSHWGNIAIEGDFEARHDGATLKGQFSRFDFQRQMAARQNAIQTFKQILPLDANEIYYRDEIGNISTSNLIATETGLEFLTEPRFPLFGGWRTNSYFGYNLPAAPYLGIDSNSGKFVLNVTLLEPFDDAVVDQLTVRVILPEGAQDIQLIAPFAFSNEKRTTHYTYLDTSGRPVLTLERQAMYQTKKSISKLPTASVR